MVMKLYHCSLIHYLLLFVCFGGIILSKCEVFLVGGEDGWNSGINFVSWSQTHNFTKGDFLVFNYSKNEHNVYEVSEETYRSCNSSKGVLGEYDSGNDEIELKEARKYWFICNVAGHCLGGMRFGIEVKQLNSTIHLPNSDFQPPPPTTNHGSYGSYQIWSSTFIFIIAFGFVFY